MTPCNGPSDPRLPTVPLAMNEKQRATLLTVYAEYPSPWVVGWRGDVWPEVEYVRGTLYRSLDDEDDGRKAGEFSIYRDGTIHWRTRPEAPTTLLPGTEAPS